MGMRVAYHLSHAIGIAPHTRKQVVGRIKRGEKAREYYYVASWDLETDPCALKNESSWPIIFQKQSLKIELVGMPSKTSTDVVCFPHL